MLAFTGDMSYWPNEDAVLWFARAVLPRLRAEPSGPALRGGRAARRGDACVDAAARLGIHLTGAVPDVRPFLAHAALVVAPLRIAQGVPNKVLEAMAMAKAVVATPAAVAGLRAAPRTGHCPRQPTPTAFARAISQPARPALRAAALGARARARVVADYAWAPSFRLLDRLVAARSGQAAESRKADQPRG